MRIIAGKFKSRRFQPPANKWPTRPTTDFAREALFNVLVHQLDIENMRMLDLFGGMGGNSFEAISRGCKEVIIVEKHRGCVQFIKKISRDLKIETQLQVMQRDVFSFLKKENRPFDFIFADPPYALPSLASIPDIIFEKKMLLSDGLLVLEHDQTNEFSHHPKFLRAKQYGSTFFSFFAEENND